MDYYLTDGSKNPYVASLLGNLRHWLEDEQQVREITTKIPNIHREVVCKK